MSKIVRGIGKAVKGIVRGVKKAFKSITKSSFGKMLLIAATIYLGGAALGMWQSPFASINGALVGGAGAAPTAAGVLEGGAVAESGALATGAAETAGAVEAGAVAGEAATTAGQLSAGASEAGSLITNAAPAIESASIAAPTLGVGEFAVPQLAGGGLIQGAAAPGFFGGLSPMGQFAAITAGAGALQGAFSPNAVDAERERAEQERANLEWKNKFLAPNFNVGNVNVGRPTGQPLRDMQGNLVYPAAPQPQPIQPNGIIQRAVG